MDYIYDIVLNFQDDYYDFYEWLSNDKIINVKRIPIYKINNKEYLDIKNNIVSIDLSSLPKNNKMFLLICNYEVMGILLNNNGKVIKKSSLIYEEADDIIDSINDIKKIKIKYKIIKVNKINFVSRLSTIKELYIKDYLKNIDKEKDKYLLKYLYYDIYHIDEDNIDIIYDKLDYLSKNELNKLYDSINKINLELKK